MSKILRVHLKVIDTKDGHYKITVYRICYEIPPGNQLHKIKLSLAGSVDFNSWMSTKSQTSRVLNY